MKTTLRAVFGLGLFAMVASPVFAQGGRGLGMMGGYAMLIGHEGVQKELKLDDTQVAKAKEFAEKTREQMREHFEQLQGLADDERRTKMQEIGKEMNASALKAFGEFLKPEQLARLKQISYQQRGPGVFAEAEVAEKLNLTADQKMEIREIVQEMMQQNRKIREENEGDRETIMKKSTELRKETLAKAAAKLNDEQQKTWKEIIGAPFEVTFQRRPQ